METCNSMKSHSGIVSKISKVEFCENQDGLEISCEMVLDHTDKTRTTWIRVEENISGGERSQDEILNAVCLLNHKCRESFKD